MMKVLTRVGAVNDLDEFEVSRQSSLGKDQRKEKIQPREDQEKLRHRRVGRHAGQLLGVASLARYSHRLRARVQLLIKAPRTWITVMVWLCCCNSPALGAGFALLQQGTAAMGQGNAFVADASDASAIFYNPAGLNQLQRPQVYQGTFFNYPDREYDNGGPTSETNHRLYRNMSVYIAVPVHNRVAVGVGFFSPFGMGTVWHPEWPGRYLTTYTSMKTYTLNPVVSVKPLDNLSLAAGFDVMWSKVKLMRKSPLVIGGVQRPDAEVNLEGDGQGYGYNLGALYEPVAGVKLGVSYRSEIFIRHDGTLSTKLPLPLPSPMATAGTSDLTFPPSVTMGISYSRIRPFTFEFDATWTGWSSYDQFKVKTEYPVTVNGVLTNTVTVPKNWHDSWAFRFGANYEIMEGIKIRAGYIYDLTPVPDATFDPQVPDANRHIFTVGKEFKYKRLTLGLAYNYIYFEPRTKNNAIGFNGVPVPLQANGRYRTDTHSLGMSWFFQF